MRFFKKTALAMFLRSYFKEPDPNKHLHLETPDLHKGYNVLESALERVQNRYGFKNPLIVIGPNVEKISYKRKKLGKSLIQILEDLNCESVEKVVYSETPLTIDGVMNFYKENIKEKDISFDMCFGVGGGRVLDAAKIIAHPNHPIVTIPTTLSNDGFASPAVSVMQENDKKSFFFRPPFAIIGEYSILENSPHIRTGYGDFVAKYTSSYDWMLAASYNPEEVGFSKLIYEGLHSSAELLILSIEEMPREKEKIIISSRYIDMLLSVGVISSAAVISAGSTIPASGSEHKISHVLDLEGIEGSHAEKCGIATIPIAYLQGQDWKSVKQSLERVGVPTSFKELGVSKTKMKMIIKKARRFRPERYCILHEFSDTKTIKAFEKTEVI